MSIKKSILAILTGLTLNTIVHAAPYTITDLGDLAESTSFGNGINNNGLVIGTFLGPAADSVNIDAFGFTFDGTNFTDLGLLTFDPQVVTNPVLGVNDAGAVVGYRREDVSTDGSGLFALRGFLYQNGTFQSLGIPADASESRAIDINENGLIAGYAKITDDPAADPVLYFEKAVIIDPNAAEPYTNLGTLRADGTGRSSARSINNSGQVVGWSDLEAVDNAFDSHAFFYDPAGSATLEDIGTFGGKNSFANAINDAGTIVGLSTDSNNDTFAFSFQPGVDSALVNLGTLNSDTPFSVAYDINSNNQVVGFSVAGRPRQANQPAPSHAVLYENGNVIDLNEQIDCPLGWTLITAKGINDAGQIVGSGEINGETHAFLLTPDPNGGAAQQCTDTTDPETSDGGSVDYLLLLLLSVYLISRIKDSIIE